MADEEIILAGGQVTPVIRIGDTVRRSGQRNNALQHALFDHLAAQGFPHAPRFLGYDDEGRETLTFLPGEVLFDKDDFSDGQLAAAARMLRAYHDATVSFPPVMAAGAEVLCHNDWTPANTVFVDDLPSGMIDFDTAAPGTRLWDVTYSVWTWLGLAEPRWSPSEQRHRMSHFLSAYDHPTCSIGLIAACLPARQAGRAHWAGKRDMTAAVSWANNCLAWTLDHITHHYHPDGLP